MAARLPAEWEPQQAVWFAWPRQNLTWPNRLEAAQDAIAAAIRAIAPQEVWLIVHPEVEASCRASLSDQSHVRYHSLAHDDSWIRDYGPLTVESDDGLLALDFRFDAWGGKYESMQTDDKIVDALGTEAIGMPIQSVDFVLEGGAIETNGHGTFICSRSVVMARGQSEADVEATLARYLGAKRVIWLEGGLVGDDTDGHVDSVARFAGPDVVLAARAPEGHPDHLTLEANRDILKSAGLNVVDLPVPTLIKTGAGEILPASYANFLITNDVILVPSFGEENDETVAKIIAKSIGRPTVSINHHDLIWGMGGIHCLSMQVPIE